MKKILLTLALGIAACGAAAAQADYKVTLFGAKTDGVTDNTGSIQRAVDYISDKGGGTLWFYVGRYVTGAIELKDNVHIAIAEGAVIVAPSNIYKYNGAKGLFWAEGRSNVAVTGMPEYPGRGGVIEGNSAALASFVSRQAGKGYLPGDAASRMPAFFWFKDCVGVTVDDLKLYDPSTEVPYVFENCENATVSNCWIHKDGVIHTPDGKTVKLAK